MHVTYSNRTEILFEGLKSHLFNPERPIFGRILVIVPSPAMKSWVMHRCANDPDLQIAFGFEVLYLNEAIDRLMPKGLDKKVPHSIELALAIEKELCKCSLAKDFHELFEWGEATHSKERFLKSQKRAEASLEIANIFLNYGEYAPQEMGLWLKEQASCWQQELWQRLFKGNFHWQPLYEFLDQKTASSLPYQIHLFALSYISPIKLHFFQKISQKTPICHWILSPSRLFWGDIRSEKQQQKLLALWRDRNLPMEDLQKLMDEDNPLLGNNGRLGREFMKNLEEVSSSSDESYVISSSSAQSCAYENLLLDGIEIYPSKQLTFLHALQDDLTVLRDLKNSLIEISPLDRSVEIHGFPSVSRELEGLYQILLGTLQNSALHPGEILVLVPNLEIYTPYIQLVFNHPESQISSEIADSVYLLDSPFIQTFFSFLDLAVNRWTLEGVIQLLSKEQFKSMHSFKEEELIEFKGLLREGGVKWGINHEERQAFFEGEILDHSNEGSWEKGFESILQSYGSRIASEDFLQDGSIDFCTLQSPAYSSGESLGLFIENLKELRKVFRSLTQEPSWSLKEWAAFLLDLIDQHLIEKNEEDVKASLELKHILSQMGKWHINLPTEVFSLGGILIYLKKFFRDHSITFPEKNLNAVRFCSLLPMRAVTAKVMVLLGLNEGEFPRLGSKKGMDCLKTNPFIPGLVDYDRYLFLESLLSAREKWILSYVAPQAEEEPSLIIQELLTYVDTHYKFGEYLPSQIIHFKHPTFSFDAGYFVSSPFHINFSKADYRKACLVLDPFPQESKKLFHSPLPKEKIPAEKIPAHINISQMKSALYHPLKHYLNQNLGIYFQSSPLIPQAFIEFEEQELWESEWLKWALRYPMDRVIDLAEKKGKLPAQPFKEIAKIRLRQKLKIMLESLEKWDIKPHEVFEVEFSHDARECIQMTPYRWKLPAMQVDYRNQKISITGILPYVSSKGLLSLRDPKFETLVTSFPDFLLHGHMPQNLSLPTVLFLKKGKTKSLFEENKVESFFDYYLRVLHQPVPLLPSWIESILEDNPINLEKQMKQSIKDPFRTNAEDPYLKWALPQLIKNAPEEIIAEWKDLVKDLFGFLK